MLEALIRLPTPCSQLNRNEGELLGEIVKQEEGLLNPLSLQMPLQYNFQADLPLAEL